MLGSGMPASLIADTVFENKALTKGVAAGGLAVGVSLTEITVAPVLRAEVGAQAMVRTNTLTVTAGGPGRTAGDAGYDALAQATGSAGALVGITSTNSRVVNNAQLDALIGDGATITVARSVIVSALNNMRQKADADSKAGGLVAAGAAKSEVVFTGTSQARIGAGVMLTAQALTVEALGIEDNFARTNAGSGGAIAGASATARTTNTSTTLASIGKGSIVTLYGDPGALSVVADHTALFNAQVTSLAGGVLAGAGGEVTNLVDGKVETGLNRNLSLTLKDWNGATGQITDFTATKGITFTTSLQKPNSALSQDLITAQKNLALYSYDAQAKAGYQAQIDGIMAALRAQGLVTEGKAFDSQGRPVVQIASEQYVMTVTIDPILADSGAIRVRGDVMQGSGTWIAPNDVVVTIVNDTPASLRIKGIAIPSTLADFISMVTKSPPTRPSRRGTTRTPATRTPRTPSTDGIFCRSFRERPASICPM